MHENISDSIGQSLSNFQAALNQEGNTLGDFIGRNYLGKWLGDSLYHALAIRTTYVNAMHNYLVDAGLFNIDRVSMSPVTDPLAHDVEHTPDIKYKGHTYMTTHSMIYSKFLACFNPALKGIFIDSPNIRLELESPSGTQRGRYLIDFSQMDVEIRRNRGIGLDEYLNEPKKVSAILREDYEKALSFFEDLLVTAMRAVVEKNADDLRALGVAWEIPKKPFPRFRRDEAIANMKTKSIEKPLGKQVDGHFFWITGLLRENYDLIYPYLKPDGSKVPLSDFTSERIYNYDLCAQSKSLATGAWGPAFEVLSGAIREWLYEPIIERLIDNKIIPTRPEIVGEDVANIDELGGYGPFLLAVSMKDRNGKPLFPDTFGGGVGVERSIFALTYGEKIHQIDDVTCFGKNPDSFPLYLF